MAAARYTLCRSRRLLDGGGRAFVNRSGLRCYAGTPSVVWCVNVLTSGPARVAFVLTVRPRASGVVSLEAGVRPERIEGSRAPDSGL